MINTINSFQLLNPEQAAKIKVILNGRKIRVDTPQLQQKRQDFLDFLASQTEFNQSHFKDSRLKFPLEVYGNPIKTYEQYPWNGDEVKSKAEPYNFLNPSHNTRLKINSETCLETDKIPDINKCFAFINEVCSSLMRHKYHFAVFYAVGQRSPHIRIYDFDELVELNELQRIKAQISFWRKHVPFGMFHLVDTSLFQDSHPLQLEFAPHWKYGTPFQLLFEYLPDKEDSCNH